MKDNPVKNKSYNFALRIIKLNKHIISTQKDYVLSKQILRSGTAIGALIEEADQAESKLDFIHKMSIANKEANETKYWLKLLRDGNYIKEKDAQSILIMDN